MGKSNPYLSRKIYFVCCRRVSKRTYQPACLRKAGRLLSFYLNGKDTIVETQNDNRKPKKDKQKKNHSHLRWVIEIFFISIALSAVLSLLSSELLSGAGLAASFVILAGFIGLGILFDIIGVSVTAAEERPFHSMAARKVPGAKEAIRLIRSADKVSSFCNDVVGDICGIVSGTTAAVIVVALDKLLPVQATILSLVVTALVSGLTIGGKAMGKNFAMKCSTKVVYTVGRVVHVFHKA